MSVLFLLSDALCSVRISAVCSWYRKLKGRLFHHCGLGSGLLLSFEVIKKNLLIAGNKVELKLVVHYPLGVTPTSKQGNYFKNFRHGQLIISTTFLGHQLKSFWRSIDKQPWCDCSESWRLVEGCKNKNNSLFILNTHWIVCQAVYF